jgi:hypothetical protein
MISTNFCKSEACPSPADLLDFQRNELSPSRRVRVIDHIASCDFCASEIEFYSHYPQEEGAIETTEPSGIPAPLFELAEALLKKRHTDTSSLDALLKKIETVESN